MFACHVKKLTRWKMTKRSPRDSTSATAAPPRCLRLASLSLPTRYFQNEKPLVHTPVNFDCHPWKGRSV